LAVLPTALGSAAAQLDEPRVVRRVVTAVPANARTALLTVSLSWVVGHRPFFSALAKADVRGALALLRHAGFTGASLSAAFAPQASAA
jgi:hypothetical protein